MSVDEKNSQIAIAYTLWSLKKGAGKKIMKELLKYMKKQNNIDSIMTLSPLTPVATHYHIRNGAKLIKKLIQLHKIFSIEFNFSDVINKLSSVTFLSFRFCHSNVLLPRGQSNLL